MGRRRADVEEGFETLFRREAAPLVRALTLLSGDRQNAADAVQEAFVQAHRHWSKVAGLDNPAAWVRRAAINRIRNQHRGRLRLVTATAKLTGLAQDGQAPAPSHDRVDVLAAVAALPEQQRTVVALYYLLDLPASAIAEELDIAEATVRSQLRHARERLGDLLKEVTP